MKRRKFLTQTGSTLALATLAGSVGSTNVAALTHATSLDALKKLTADSDRIFIIVQLTGGNDGLNTIIPYENPTYYNSRPTIAISKNSALRLNDQLGWHPSMAKMKQLFDNGKLSIIEGVSYPNSDRSHFRGTDIWLTATDANIFKGTGWIGRYLDAIAPQGNSLPSEPLAVQIGSTVSLGLRGSRSSLIANFRDPEAFFNSIDQTKNVTYDDVPNTKGGDELEFVRSVEKASVVYSQAVKRAADKVSNNTVTYEQTNLSQSLRIVARLIAGGLQSKFYFVTMPNGVFDTHISQGGNVGAHATLLSELSGAINSFMADCKNLGVSERVAGMTFSEFGRRVSENGSLGTDHGTAAPQFIFGENIQGGTVFGTPPDLQTLDPIGDMLMQYDYRQIYSAALLQWFGASSSVTQQTLLRDFSPLNLFKLPTSVADEATTLLQQSTVISPNPSTGDGVISFSALSQSPCSITLCDIRGTTVARLWQGETNIGHNSCGFSINPTQQSGIYFVRITIGRSSSLHSLHIVR